MIQIPSALYSELLSALQCLQCQIKAEYNMVYIITHRCCLTVTLYLFCVLQKSGKGFLFAKLYFEAKEYELAKR